MCTQVCKVERVASAGQRRSKRLAREQQDGELYHVSIRVVADGCTMEVVPAVEHVERARGQHFRHFVAAAGGHAPTSAEKSKHFLPVTEADIKVSLVAWLWCVG